MFKKFSFAELRKSALGGFRKSLVFEVSLMALLYSSVAYSNEVNGWIGPISTCGDTGHIELSDNCVQGEHSLKFVMRHVEQGPNATRYDSMGHVVFKKYFAGIKFPDSIVLHVAADTSCTNDATMQDLKITYKDTLWETRTWKLGMPPHTNWNVCYHYWAEIEWPCEPWPEQGNLVSPDTIANHAPPGNIDTLMFEFNWYNHSQDGAHQGQASIYIDSLVFVYLDGGRRDTMVDGMGDDVGVEENQGEPDLFSISVFPNPFSSQTEIKLSALDLSSIKDISLYDLAGRKIESLMIQKRVVLGNNLLAGIYFLHIKTQKREKLVKLVKLI